MSTLGMTSSFSLRSRKHVFFKSSTKNEAVLPIISDVDVVVRDNSVRGCLSIPMDHLIYDTVIPDFFKTKIL